MDGGLTTIEEKSMGAMVKSGTRPIRGVLKIAQAPKKPGLYLLDTTPDEKLGPAHHEAADPSDMLDLIACGAHIVFLVTGRGHVGHSRESGDQSNRKPPHLRAHEG